MPRRILNLDQPTLERIGFSGVLAIEPSALNGFAAIQEIAPTNREATEGGERVALVDIAGPMAQRAIDGFFGYVEGYDAIAARFLQAVNHPEAGAVVVRIDTPGGTTAGLDQAVETMAAAAKASGKPVFVYVDELCASAGYRIASGIGAQIFAPPSGSIGSVGAISTLVDTSAALEREGIKVTLIREPEGKAEAHPNGPVADLAEGRARERTRAVAESFYAQVAISRGLTVEQVSALNGAVLSAPDALSAGLIDGVDSFSGVVARAAKHISENRMTIKLNEELAAKAAASDPILASVAAITGTNDPEAAVAALQALSQSAARASEYEAQQTAAAAKSEADAASKAALIASLQADKKLPKVQVPWAESVSLEVLQGFAETAVPFGGAKVDQAATSHAVVDPALEAELKRFGVTTAEHLTLKAKAAAKAKE